MFKRQQPTAKAPWFRRKWVQIVGAGFLGFVLGSGGAETVSVVDSVEYQEQAGELQEVEDRLAAAESDVARLEKELEDATAEAATEESAAPEPSAAPSATTKPPKKRKPRKPAPAMAQLVVTRVVDGDTVEMSDGSSVRVIGIDTPERGECGFGPATYHMRQLVEGKPVVLVEGARDDADRYGRLLRYIDVVGGPDAGLAQIKAGLAIARYDSRDGYGAHTREASYIAADRAKRHECGIDRPAPAPKKEPAPPPAGGGTDPRFGTCTEAIDHGFGPYYRGQDAEYDWYEDRDGDGAVCE